MKVTLYEVMSDKEKWRGSYSTSLNLPNQPDALSQAIINAKSHNGKVFAVYEDDSRELVWPKQ